MKLTAALFFVAASWATAAFAGPPTQFLQKQVDAVRALLRTPGGAEIDGKLKAVVDPVMDFDGLSEKALKKHWPTLTVEQRQAFIALFRDLVFDSYLRKVRGASENYTVAYEDEEARGPKAASVTTVAKTAKAEIELVFLLQQRSKDVWVAEDVIIDEVSLVENYREQFNKIIAESGFQALLDKMKKKLAEIRDEDKKAPAPAAPVK